MSSQLNSAVIKHFALKDITVVGHSFGCLIALHLAAKQPSLIKSLVLFVPVPSPLQAIKHGYSARAQAVRKGGMPSIADAVIGNTLPLASSRPVVSAFVRELLCRQNSEGYSLALEALAGSEHPRWALIKAPTTIISGTADKVSAPGVAQAVASLLKPSCSVDVIAWEGIGHWHPFESPEKASTMVKRLY